MALPASPTHRPLHAARWEQESCDVVDHLTGDGTHTYQWDAVFLRGLFIGHTAENNRFHSPGQHNRDECNVRHVNARQSRSDAKGEKKKKELGGSRAGVTLGCPQSDQELPSGVTSRIDKAPMKLIQRLRTTIPQRTAASRSSGMNSCPILKRGYSRTCMVLTGRCAHD